MRQSCCALLVLLTLAVDFAQATPPTPQLSSNSLDVRSATVHYRPQRRTVSPYLSLVPGNLNLPAINYFNIVRPEIVQTQVNRDQGSEIRQLELEFRNVAAEAKAAEADATGVVRPKVGFQTQRKYFDVKMNRTLQAAEPKTR